MALFCLMTPDELLVVGRQLRQVRLERDYTLQQVESATRIRARFLEAIEEGEYDSSVTEVQIRGFVRNYAVFLQLDLEAMLWSYRQGQQTKRKSLFGLRIVRDSDPDPIPAIPIRKTSTGSMPTPPQAVARVNTRSTQEMAPVETSSSLGRLLRIALWLVLFLGLLGAGAGGAYFMGEQMDSSRNDSNQDVETVPLNIATDAPLVTDGSPGLETANTSTPVGSTTPGGIVVRPPEQVNMTGADSIAVTVSANQRSWVRLTVDGTIEYEGLLRPGTALNYQGEQSITLRTSNAGGLAVVVNNQDLGILGERGTLYEQTFSLDGFNLPANTTPLPNSETNQEAPSGAPPPILPDGSLGDPGQVVVPTNTQPSLPTPIPTPAEVTPGS
jgi:hypothetical protein